MIDGGGIVRVKWAVMIDGGGIARAKGRGAVKSLLFSIAALI